MRTPEAITAANEDSQVGGCPAAAAHDLISIPAGTYRLAVAGAGEQSNPTGDLDILELVTIRHVGARLAILDGNGSDRVSTTAPWGR